MNCKLSSLWKTEANQPKISSNIPFLWCCIECWTDLDHFKIWNENKKFKKEGKISFYGVGWVLIAIKHFIQHFGQDQKKFFTELWEFSCLVGLVVLFILMRCNQNIFKFSTSIRNISQNQKVFPRLLNNIVEIYIFLSSPISTHSFSHALFFHHQDQLVHLAIWPLLSLSYPPFCFFWNEWTFCRPIFFFFQSIKTSPPSLKFCFVQHAIIHPTFHLTWGNYVGWNVGLVCPGLNIITSETSWNLFFD